MKIIQKNNDKYILTIGRGEEIFFELEKFTAEENISCCTFVGLGAVSDIEIAYYNLNTKEYERQELVEDLEILNFTGNMAFLNEKKVFHIHGVFGRRDLSTLGGHLFSMRVSGACEIHLTTYTEKIGREYDEETGLNLICKIA